MTTSNEHFHVDYDARLVEEAMLRALRGRAEEGDFHRERDRLYEIADAEERDAAFRAFHGDWFVRLGLDRLIRRAFDERPRLRTCVGRCAVTAARSKRDEGADLFVSPAEAGQGEAQRMHIGADRRSIGIQVRPESLLEPDRLLDLLRHELLHVEDMLDPLFGYEPVLPRSEVGPAYDRLLQDRYRALWDATIDGRLLRAGVASGSVRDRCLRDFARAFPMFGERTPEAFSRFFDGTSHTHADLVAFALDPDAHLERSHIPHRGTRCPVCGFPTYDLEPAAERLPPDFVARVTADFPGWHPAQGICRQCADLYRARPLSEAELALLPKG
jgi:hypothetical protein